MSENLQTKNIERPGNKRPNTKRPIVQTFEEADITRVIEMAWEDRTPFEAIEFQFGIPEAEVIKLMRTHLKAKSFKNWRARVNSKVSSKHQHKRSSEIDRFHCATQYKPKSKRA